MEQLLDSFADSIRFIVVSRQLLVMLGFSIVTVQETGDYNICVLNAWNCYSLFHSLFIDQLVARKGDLFSAG